MTRLSRRTFLERTGAALLALGGLAPDAHAGGARWLLALQDLTVALERGRISTGTWRRRAQRIARGAPAAVRRLADPRANAIPLVAEASPEPQRELVLEPPAGIDRWAFTTILAHIRPGTAVVPHGHHGMVSMHVIVAGEVRLRQYDRVRDEPEHLVLRPRADRLCGPGDTTAIAATRGNVHWFQGVRDAYALIVAAYDLDGGPTARDYVDPDEAEALADGTLRAPRLDVAEAYRRYARF
jgi:hypothetical protein